MRLATEGTKGLKLEVLGLSSRSANYSISGPHFPLSKTESVK
jgi:hypothetical protein